MLTIGTDLSLLFILIVNSSIKGSEPPINANDIS